MFSKLHERTGIQDATGVILWSKFVKSPITKVEDFFQSSRHRRSKFGRWAFSAASPTVHGLLYFKHLYTTTEVYGLSDHLWERRSSLVMRFDICLFTYGIIF